MKNLAKYLFAVVAIVPLLSFSTCNKETVTPKGLPEPADTGEVTGDRRPVGPAELPVMLSDEEIRYVTHYVSADGNSSASADTPGRVRNYTTAFDVVSLQPLWVAYPMHSWYDGDAGRTSSWHADPSVPVAEQPYLRRSYQPVGDNGLFSRGHLLASDCRQRSRAMNAQTFYYTNSAPQTQNAFNAGIWLRLEELERESGFRGLTADTLYVVTGSTFFGVLRETSDDRGNIISAPSHFYKALLTTRSGATGKPIDECSAAELKSVAFYLDHFGHASNARPGEQHMMSVDELERITGIDFFPMIAPEAEVVESSFNAADWGL